MTLRPRRENALNRKQRLAVMPKIDVTDEAVIDAPPVAVYKAILNEYAGVTHWWMPVLEFKLRGNKPFDCEGAICDLTAHGSGMSAKFSVKITKIVEAKSIEFDYSGDFLGTGKWTFEPKMEKRKHNIDLTSEPISYYFLLSHRS